MSTVVCKRYMCGRAHLRNLSRANKVPDHRKEIDPRSHPATQGIDLHEIQYGNNISVPIISLSDK